MDQDFLATAFAMESCEDEDDPDRTDEWGWPLLHAALSTSHFDVAMSLLQKGASQTARTPGGLTALHLVCGASGQPESAASLAVLQKLISDGQCDVNDVDSQEKTALFHAACYDNITSAKILLSVGALPNKGKGDTALLRAVMRDNKPLAEMLLAAGARDDGAYRKALLMKGACGVLGPLMASPSRLSVSSPLSSDVSSDVEMPDSMLLLPAPPDSECRIIWGSSVPPAPRVHTLSEFYRLRVYEKTHTLLLGMSKDKDVAIAAVSKWPDLSSRCLVVFVIRKLHYEYIHLSKLENPLLFASERFPDFVWQLCSDAAALNLKAHVLGIESKLSKRSLNMAVVFGSKDQWREAEMFDTPMLLSHGELMGALGEETEIDESMEGLHTGGLPQGKKCYYTAFCGFEICMHVAALLSTDERRQFLGNDKVVLYICDEGALKPLVPRFRGEVNSVAIVVQQRGPDRWKMACFCRERVVFAPKFPGNEMSLALLRKYIFSVAIDANAAVMASRPYESIVGRVIQDMIVTVWPDERKKQHQRSKSLMRSNSHEHKTK